MRIYTFIIIFILSTSLSFAQTEKIITLKDGSILKGVLLELDAGVYTVKTENLGQVEINESDVLSINVPESIIDEFPKTNTNQNADITATMDQSQVMIQTQQMQKKLLSDPNLMKDVQNMLSDKKLIELMSDPQLMIDLKSMNKEKIKNNENVQQLINHPQMQNLIMKMMGSSAPSQ